MKILGKRIIPLVLCLCLAIAAFPVIALGAESDDSNIEYIKLYTELNPMGRYPVKFELTLSDPTIAADIKAEDFSMSGRRWNWMTFSTGATAAFTIAAGNVIESVSLDGNVLTLNCVSFGDDMRYYLLSEYSINCVANPLLTFTKADIDETSFPAGDLFDIVVGTAGDLLPGTPNMQFNYYLNRPDSHYSGRTDTFDPATDEPLPLVLFSHGMSDQMGPEPNRWVAAFAESHHQSRNPSYIMAPMYVNANAVLPNPGATAPNNNGIADASVAQILKWVEEGRVDPNRIYVAGKSMGGQRTHVLMDRHGEIFAAAMPTCATSYTYSGTGGTNFTRAADKLINTPYWAFYSEGDSAGIRDFSRNVFTALQNANAFMAKNTELTYEQVNTTKYNDHHSTEHFCVESDIYVDWMFRQSKALVADNIKYAKAFASVTAEGTIIDSIQLLAMPGADLSDLAFTVDGKAATTSVAGSIITISGFSVNASANFAVAGPAGFSFSSTDIRDTLIKTADAFIQHSAGMSNGFNYDHGFYIPPTAPNRSNANFRNAWPLVLVFSKANDNLRDNRVVTSWAEQDVKEAVVLAPSVHAPDFIQNTLNTVNRYKSVPIVTDVYVTGDDKDAIDAFLAAYDGDVKNSFAYSAAQFALFEDDIIDALFGGATFETATHTSTRPAELVTALQNYNRVYLNTPSNLGIFEQHSPFTVPAGKTLVVVNVLNIHGTINVEGTLIVAEGGRINNQRGGTINIAAGGALINNGYVENVTGSFVVNAGTITNNDRFEIRAGTTWNNTGTVNGSAALRINNGAIRP